MNYTINENIIPFEDMKNDNILKVVIAYGALYKNTSTITFNSKIEVLFCEIDSKTNKLNDKFFVKHISVDLLCIVRIGVVFFGNKITKEKWNNSNNFKRNVTLNFDLIKEEPLGVEYFTQYFNKISKLDFYDTKVELTKATKFHFKNLQYTQMILNNKTKVILSSYEWLNTYSPFDEFLKADLLKYNIDYILDKYCYLDKCFLSGNSCVMSFKNNLKEESIYFLAYLKFNLISRIRVSKLWANLEKKEFDENYFEYSDKYPIILPYHPKELKIKADGIWMDENTFFVLRINECSLPKQYGLSIIIKEYNKNNIERYELLDVKNKLKYSNSIDNNAQITQSNIPNVNNLKKFIKSDIRIINENVPIKKIKKHELITIKNDILSIERNESQNKINKLSFEEPNNSENSKNIGKLNIERNKFVLEKHKFNLLDNLLKNLRQEKITFSKDKKVYLTSFIYFNERFEWQFQMSIPSFINILNLKDNNIYAYWSQIYFTEKKQRNNRDRCILLCKLFFSNGESFYLLEIDSKSSEFYSGLVFKDDNFKRNEFVNLIKRIYKNRGKYKSRYEIRSKEGDEISYKLIDVDLGLKNYFIFKHTSSFENTIKNVIKRGLKM